MGAQPLLKWRYSLSQTGFSELQPQCQCAQLQQEMTPQTLRETESPRGHTPPQGRARLPISSPGTLDIAGALRPCGPRPPPSKGDPVLTPFNNLKLLGPLVAAGEERGAEISPYKPTLSPFRGRRDPRTQKRLRVCPPSAIPAQAGQVPPPRKPRAGQPGHSRRGARSAPRGLCPRAALVQPARAPRAFPARRTGRGLCAAGSYPQPRMPGAARREARSHRYLQGPPRLSAPRRRHLAFQTGCTFQGVNSDL